MDLIKSRAVIHSNSFSITSLYNSVIIAGTSQLVNRFLTRSPPIFQKLHYEAHVKCLHDPMKQPSRSEDDLLREIKANLIEPGEIVEAAGKSPLLPAPLWRPSGELSDTR